MDKVSLGVILRGNPRCRLKEKKWQENLSVIVKFAWIYYLVGIAVIIFLIKVANNHDPTLRKYLYALFAGGLFAFVAWFMEYVYGPKVRCPCCKHFRNMVPISDKQLIDSRVDYVSRRVDEYGDGVVYNLTGDFAFYTTHTKSKVWDKKTTNTYTYNVRCKICGCVAKVETKTTTTTSA